MEWNAREVRIARFQDGGSWLSSNRAYQQWKMDPDQHLLLIEGKPGSGKSTLVKHVARMIRDEQVSLTAFRNNQTVTHGD
jgi:predicted ATPase